MIHLIRRLLRLGQAAAYLIVVAWLGACGSSGSGTGGGTLGSECVPGTAGAADNCGSVLVAVTDADGDFVSYTVDVLSVSLQRASGGGVETLPAAARVDFAELTDLSELLSAATLAPGDFAGGTIRLDYDNAEIFVESAGEIVAAQAVDLDGAPLGVIDVEIRLADREHLVLTRGRTALLSIDFDLAASHDVDLSGTTPLVTAQPYLVAEVRPVTEKELRVRGALIDADVGSSSYDIRVRPWHRHDGDFGTFTVHTTPTTEFEIGDTSLTGADGLAALAALDSGTLTVAFGTLDLPQRQFTATIVHAGNSVGGTGFAAVEGNVVSRSDDTLTVKGGLAIFRDRPARFRRTVTIGIGVDTHVSKTGDRTAGLDKDDISVGQRIVAFGQIVNPVAADADPFAPDIPLALDATQGRVRLQVTRLHGSINAVAPGQVNLTLGAIDRLGIGLFDFAGTGPDPTSDATPSDYEVDTGTVNVSGLEVGQRARIHGFVARFGAAPPDFIGRTVVDHRAIPAVLGIAWGIAGTSAPFTSMEAGGLVLDLGNPDIGERHHLLLGRELIDLYTLPVPATVAANEAPGLYGISSPEHIELFKDFSAFVDEIATRLGAGSTARAVAASGTFDETTTTVGARRVVVHMTGAP